MMDFDGLDELEERRAQQQQPFFRGGCEADPPAPEPVAAAPEEDSKGEVEQAAEEAAPVEEESAEAPVQEDSCAEAEGAQESREEDSPGGDEIVAEGKVKDLSKGDSVQSSSLFNMQKWEALDRRCAEFPAVKSIAETLNFSPLLVASAGSCGILAFLLHGFGGQLLCTFLGFLYPAFESFKAAELCQPSIMQFWLTYWVVWGVFITLEHCCYYIVIWLPFYYPLKLAALVWLFHPATKGAKFVYRWLLLPILLKNQDRIDAALEESSQKLKRGVSGALTGAVGMGFNTALAAGAGTLPKVRNLSRSISGVLMEALLTQKMASQEEEKEEKE